MIFRDDEDYVTAMNYVAIGIQSTSLKLLTFCLMSNHVHFIIHGKIDIIQKFIISFKIRVSLWIRHKYGEARFLRGLPVGIKQIKGEEYLKTAIAYVLRNPLSANLGNIPQCYNWSSCSCYFSNLLNSDFIKAMSLRQKRRSFHSKSIPSEHVKVHYNGMIDPVSYVDNKFVEQLFRTPKSFLYYLSKDVEAKTEEEIMTDNRIQFDDRTIIKYITDICKTTYNVNDINSISLVKRFTLIKQLRQNFKASSKQISRLLNLPLEVVKEM